MVFVAFASLWSLSILSILFLTFLPLTLFHFQSSSGFDARLQINLFITARLAVWGNPFSFVFAIFSFCVHAYVAYDQSLRWPCSFIRNESELFMTICIVVFIYLLSLSLTKTIQSTHRNTQTPLHTHTRARRKHTNTFSFCNFDLCIGSLAPVGLVWHVAGGVNGAKPTQCLAAAHFVCWCFYLFASSWLNLYSCAKVKVNWGQLKCIFLQ